MVGDSGRIQRNLAFYESRKLDVHYEDGINNGVAQAYWQAEHWAFEETGADLCIFIEDDIVISKHFFATMKSLGRLALNENRIGAFSAFGNAGIPWASQWQQRHHLLPMHHRWAYGITRDYWMRFRSDYQDYLNLMQDTDYRNRPHEAISHWLRNDCNAENTAHITSQDSARTAIMLKLGCFSAMTTPSYAVNIGKRGLHSFPEIYLSNRTQIKGAHAFFPLPTRFPPRLTKATAEHLTAENRSMIYW